jgi:hypothetical protein
MNTTIKNIMMVQRAVLVPVHHHDDDDDDELPLND